MFSSTMPWQVTSLYAALVAACLVLTIVTWRRRPRLLSGALLAWSGITLVHALWTVWEYFHPRLLWIWDEPPPHAYRVSQYITAVLWRLDFPAACALAVAVLLATGFHRRQQPLDPLTAGTAHFEHTLNLIARLDEKLLAKINKPIPEGERYTSVEALSESLSHRASGMAELLFKMGVYTEEEFYALTPRIWAWQDDPPPAA